MVTTVVAMPMVMLVVAIQMTSVIITLMRESLHQKMLELQLEESTNWIGLQLLRGEGGVHKIVLMTLAKLSKTI